MKPGNYRGIPVLKRLAIRTTKTQDGCWLFKGRPFAKSGHCRITWDGKQVLIHRVAWLLLVGKIPKGKWVLHRCVAHPNCWNPEHLYVGNALDNSRDCRNQGRIWDRRGERNTIAVLTEKAVREIRLIGRNVTSLEISKIYGCSSSAIRAVRNGRTWKHVHE